MKLSQIKKKFPKAWGEFEKSYPLRINADTNIRIWWSDLTDFFDKKKIYIASVVSDFDGVDYHYRIIVNGYYQGDHFKSRARTERTALTKAFEILENKLKGEGK